MYALKRLNTAVLLISSLFWGWNDASAQVRPNVVFVMSDDHAAHAISAYQKYLKYGTHLPRTPNLDRLARSGMLFVNSVPTWSDNALPKELSAC